MRFPRLISAVFVVTLSAFAQGGQSGRGNPANAGTPIVLSSDKLELLPAGTVTAPAGGLEGPARMLWSPHISTGGVLGGPPPPPGPVVVVVGLVVVVVGPVVVVVGPVVVVVGLVVVVVGSVVVVVVVLEAGRIAMVAASGSLPEAEGDQVLAPSSPGFTPATVATAT